MNLSTLKSSRVANRLVLAVMILGAVGFVVGPMLRGRTAHRSGPLTPEQQEQENALRREAESLRHKLDAAQQAALQKNPTLAARQRELVDVVDTKLKAVGIDSARLSSSMKELKARVEDAKLPEADRREAATEAMALMEKLELARGKVLAEPAVASKLQSFRGELLTEMRKDDPSIGKLLQELEETEAKLQALQPPT